jgi:acyl-homoserine-lactone acylase
MKKLAAVLAISIATAAGAQAPRADVARWEKIAQSVTIVRDDWGIPHIYGKTDADVVFGLLYAQAEDDFNRVETNFINSQGRLAEAEGEAEIWRDLRMKLFIHPDSMKKKYTASAPWLQKLMVAWADGLNYYLYKHPEVKPRVITKFEPWMALTFSEGSIGGDIEKVNLGALEAFYGGTSSAAGTGEESFEYREPTGSNGIAIAPSNTTNKRALLLINPHTSFFFREEAQMVSDEGLNAYGALTWGQFFIYQGFNDKAGWMHTTSSVDDLDEYLETVTQKGDKYFYKYGNAERPIIAEKITVPYKSANGTMAKREFTVYRSHHGPIVRKADGKWVSFKAMQEPVKALTQSYLRTKAKNYAEFKKIMDDYKTNSSNNTIFADADGNISYFHAIFVPKRNTKFDWTKPVDGSDPATEWAGLHSVDETPHLKNPATGWLYNTNNWPYSAAGPSSPKKASYPAYMDNGSENARGVHAIMVLENKKDFTVSSLISAAYDSFLPAFRDMIPALVKAYDAAPASNPLKAKLADQIAMLRTWDFRWSATSVPTSLAVFWGEEVGRRVGADARRAGIGAEAYVATKATADQLLGALETASNKLATDFGSWKTPWGDINRYQRLTGDIVQPFSDAGPSIPVGFTSARWGSLASFGARAYPGTKKWYGTSGNSFVAVVEFGKDSVRAKAVTAGGVNSVPGSKHFNDQAQRYATGNLRDVYFYKSQLAGHTERTYHPGQ